MDDLIWKYVKGETNTLESEQVENWINASEGHRKKYHLIKAKYVLGTFDVTQGNIDVEARLTSFKTMATKQPAPSLKPLLRYAAAFIVLIGLGTLFLLMKGGDVNMTAPENAIVLEMEDGSTRVVTENNKEILRNKQGEVIGVQQENELVYTKKETAVGTDQVNYNTLKVPYGKRFNITLSDGSKVYLNSGTSMRYPTQFSNKGNREVYLQGEAFFEVAKDSKHPFIVSSNNLNVRVLGTKFNVSSYEEDSSVQTVLVEGAVSLYNSDDSYDTSKKTYLTPGHKAIWDKKQHDIQVEQADVSIYTSWMDGQMVYKHMALKNILKKLERQYNVTIEKPSDSLGNQKFTATFDGTQSIYEVLKTFKKHYGIQYRMEGGKFIINK
ncbi:FecR domain-containing protein [Galbibacter sp. PAP.153]|uniref:FecR family protein n=1 Tax=Galbibacter sp. PAP.153 TaxID=3104623 RepID=UPI003008CFB9